MEKWLWRNFGAGEAAFSSGTEEKSLAIYRDLALSDVVADYEAAMRTFPVR